MKKSPKKIQWIEKNGDPYWINQLDNISINVLLKETKEIGGGPRKLAESPTNGSPLRERLIDNRWVTSFDAVTAMAAAMATAAFAAYPRPALGGAPAGKPSGAESLLVVK